MGRDLGDFQTPPALVAAILARLTRGGACWSRVLEPTCGRGNFVVGLLALDQAPREILGIEVQPSHLAEARAIVANAPGSVRVSLTAGNLFDCDLATLPWKEKGGSLLVVGNPPWVTNAEFGVLESTTRPPRSNLKNARGIDAITGGSNFDAAEAVWIKVLTELVDQGPTIALLCKTAVARSVLEHARKLRLSVTQAEIFRIDAKAWFGAAVDACLLVLRLAGSAESSPAAIERIPVFADLITTEPESMMGFVRDRIVSDLKAYGRFGWADGDCPLVWRQGVKHDAATVMELSPGPHGGWINKQGDAVEIEPDFVYPLLKGTDLSHALTFDPERAVIVTQHRIGEDTRGLATVAPKLWNYLQEHSKTFTRRKSSVYRDRPPFAMFGIGPYSFAPYKVGVSGLHRTPLFQAVGPVHGRPVMLDDTCYFLPCESAEQAALIATLLNGPDAIGLLASLAHPGAKRRVTKGLLQRLDLATLFARANHDALFDHATSIVVRLSRRPPSWPRPVEALLGIVANPSVDKALSKETPESWPSPPLITSAVL